MDTLCPPEDTSTHIYQLLKRYKTLRALLSQGLELLMIFGTGIALYRKEVKVHPPSLKVAAGQEAESSKVNNGECL